MLPSCFEQDSAGTGLMVSRQLPDAAVKSGLDDVMVGRSCGGAGEAQTIWPEFTEGWGRTTMLTNTWGSHRQSIGVEELLRYECRPRRRHCLTVYEAQVDRSRTSERPGKLQTRHDVAPTIPAGVRCESENCNLCELAIIIRECPRVWACGRCMSSVCHMFGRFLLADWSCCARSWSCLH